MAARAGIAKIAGVATGVAAKTLLQLEAAENHAISITEIGIGFHGIVNTDEPIIVDLLRQTTTGTMTSLTLVKADDSIADALDTTGLHTATAEPTGGDVLRTWTVHPQTNMVLPVSPDGPIIVGAGDRIGLRVTAGVSVTADAYICFEE